MERDHFIFDNVSSLEYGVYIKGAGAFKSPKRKYKTYEVPGKNGVLTMEEGISFEEIKHTYPASFIARNFKENLRNMSSALLAKSGKLRLSDTYNPEEYYLARLAEGIDADPAPGAVAGEFDIVFMRDPRRFLVSGEEMRTVSTGSTLYNPTEYDARPIIHVYGYGTLGIGENTITIASNSKQYIIIDSEMMDCYYQTENLNNLISFSKTDFPTLKPGINGVTYSGHITRVDIKPNWWRI